MSINNNMEFQSLKKIAKGAGFLFTGLLISKLLTYAYRLIVARIGTEQYGLLSLGFAVVGIIGTIALFGLSSGVLRYVSFYKGKADEGRIKGVITSSLKITFPLSLFFAFLMFLSAKWISINLFHNTDLIIVLRMFSLTIPFFTLSTVFLSAIRAFQKIEYEVFTKYVFENVVKVVLTIILIYLGYGLFGAIIAYVLAIISTFLLSFYFLEKKVFPIFKSKVTSITLNKELLSYSWPLMFTAILLIILGWTDTLMIGYFRTISEVGIYNAALPTAALLSIIPVALLGLYIPVMTGLFAKKKNKELGKTCKITTKWIFFTNFPIFLLLVLFSKQILKILFGPEYVLGSIALSILAFGYLFFSIFYLTTKVLEVIKKTRLILINSIISTILNIALNFYLIPIYGIVGGAIATSMSLTLFGLLGYLGTYYFTGIQPIQKNYLKPISSGLISILIIYKLTKLLFTPTPVYALFLMFGLFLLIYLALLLIFKGFEREDVEILKAIERKIGFNFISNKIIKK